MRVNVWNIGRVKKKKRGCCGEVAVLGRWLLVEGLVVILVCIAGMVKYYLNVFSGQCSVNS